MPKKKIGNLSLPCLGAHGRVVADKSWETESLHCVTALRR